MAVETKLVALLSATSAITALVKDRIYPLILPQNQDLPAISYTRIIGMPVYSLKGYSGLDNVHVQIDCWASTYAGAKAVAAAVLAAIDTATTFKGVMSGDRDMYEDDVQIYRVSMDWSLWNRRA